jgi:uncharacterized protein YyaL (SSP411 family)
VLRSLAARWKNNRAELLARADQIAESIQSNFAAREGLGASFEPDGLLKLAVGALARRYDPLYGGFSSRRKFPSPHQLELLLTAHQRGVSPRALEMLTKTLDEMAFGGINDQLAGGFHRYSTEPTWSLPHFEKMLYDNAQLLPLYARAYRVTGNALYRRTAENIARYLVREMTHPEGGLYSAQDAEVDAEEGASYVWTEDQVRETLGGDEAEELLSVYQLVPVEPHATPSPGALRLRLPLAPALTRLKLAGPVDLMDHFADSREKLLARRARRPQPMRDEKILAGWNGLAIRGLVDAGVDLERPDYIDAAARCAHFVLTRLLSPDGTLHRSYIAGRARENAIVNDYAFLADGLVALYSATGSRRWLTSARELADRMLADYEGPAGAGFYLSAGDGDLFVRPRVLADNVIPSGNSVALRLLLDLAVLTGAPEYRAAAERTQTALGLLIKRSPSRVGTAVRALAKGPQLPAPPLERKVSAEPPRRATPLSELPTGRDFVRSSVEPIPGQESHRRVLLEISKGWHVNANPASLGFLIPTGVELTRDGSGGLKLAEVVYPKSTNFSPRFSLEPLAVYEGDVSIHVELPRNLPESARLELTFQACDAATCLPPETVPLAIP